MKDRFARVCQQWQAGEIIFDEIRQKREMRDPITL